MEAPSGNRRPGFGNQKTGTKWQKRLYREILRRNGSKNNFSFAMARYIPQQMRDFEDKILRKYTPCLFKSDDEIVSALAIVHTELMLIHPFREGNGRAGRLLSVLMALQVGLPGLDFMGISGKKRKEYFAFSFGLSSVVRSLRSMAWKSLWTSDL